MQVIIGPNVVGTPGADTEIVSSGARPGAEDSARESVLKELQTSNSEATNMCRESAEK